MDLATIIGLVSGSVLILISIVIGGSALIFINIPGLLIVVGGTLAATFIKFTMADVIGSISVAMKAFLVKMEAPENIIQEMVEFTRIAKKEGLIALDAPPPDLGELAQMGLVDGREAFERWRIQRALVDSDWNQSAAAQKLGLSRAGLFKKMRKLGLVRPDDDRG